MKCIAITWTQLIYIYTYYLHNPISNCMLILTLPSVWPIILFTILPSPTVHADPLPNPPFPQLCPPCASVLGWWNHSKFNGWNWIGSWTSSPLSSDCNKNTSQKVETQPSSDVLHHMRIFLLPFQSNQLRNSLVVFICFWACPSSCWKDYNEPCSTFSTRSL